MGQGQNFLTRVGSGQPSMVWVWVWKISPKNVKFFHFFPFWSKKISSGKRRVGLLFTAGQKNAWVGSGQGPSLDIDQTLAPGFSVLRQSILKSTKYKNWRIFFGLDNSNSLYEIQQKISKSVIRKIFSQNFEMRTFQTKYK